MVILKVAADTGVLSWAKRVGSIANDKANGIGIFQGYLYVVGESDSPGWTSAKTDMTFLKLDP